MRQCAVICLLAAACAGPARAEDRPVALLFPAPAEGISREAMDRALGGFAEGMVKAGAWRVVDRQDLDLLLRAQEVLLSGAFAEGDAVRVGGLLSADLVVSFAAGAVEGGVRLTARALDPGTGEVKRSETAVAPPGADLSLESSRLAFRLAGIPVPEGAHTGTGRGSLTVSADRDGADVFLDGRPVGRTPLVLDPLAFGRYALSIRAGSLAYEAPVTVDGDVKVRGSLILATGGLIVQTDPPGALVRVGNASYGAKRLIEKLPAERQTVTLSLPGYHWKGVVPILAGKTVRVSVALAPTAALRVDADPRVSSRLSGGEIDEEFQGGRTVGDLPAGPYTLVSSRPDRRTGTRDIVLAPGESASVRVDLALSDDAAARASSWNLEMARLREEVRALALPTEFEARPVPDLGGLAVGGTLLSFVPLADLFLLVPAREVPAALRTQADIVRTAHFSLGLLAQAGLAAALLIGDGPWRVPLAVAAGIGAVADVALGAVFGLQWADWTAAMKARKAAHDAKAHRIQALEADLARMGG